jgi:ribosomal-protein-alanine N-acetyltransferase
VNPLSVILNQLPEKTVQLWQESEKKTLLSIVMIPKEDLQEIYGLCEDDIDFLSQSFINLGYNPDFDPIKTPPNPTQRLHFRSFLMEDAAVLYEFRRNPLNFPNVDMAVWQDLQEAYDYLEKMQIGMKKRKWFIYGIVLTKTNQTIGFINFWNIDWNNATAEIGYVLFPEFRHQGYMTEAVNSMIHFGFSCLHLDKILGVTQKNNLASRQVLLRSGFQYFTSIEDIHSMTHQMIPMDVYQYIKK